jgi:BlaI family transcriptional regulator, penicillinase repressor
MAQRQLDSFSRRERQIMDVLYARGEASAAQVQAALPDAPGYSAVRALLRILIDKGHVKHRLEGKKYLYAPQQPRTRAAKTAMQKVLQTFYEGSTVQAVAALLDIRDKELSDEELEQLSALIDEARREGR